MTDPVSLIIDENEVSVPKGTLIVEAAKRVGIEIPVLLNGTGDYFSIGELVDKIENCNYAIRVRQIVIKTVKKSKVELFLDFVIMEKSF